MNCSNQALLQHLHSKHDYTDLDEEYFEFAWQAPTAEGGAGGGGGGGGSGGGGGGGGGGGATTAGTASWSGARRPPPQPKVYDY